MRRPPKVLLKAFWYLLKAARIGAWVMKIETRENQRAVSTTIMMEARARVNAGVSGLITRVKRLRKYSVALGFRTFVMKPILMA